MPTKGGPHCRVSSPRVGCSILMTSAPKSPRIMLVGGWIRLGWEEERGGDYESTVSYTPIAIPYDGSTHRHAGRGMEGRTDLAKGPASTRVMSSTRSPSSGGGGRGDGGDGDAPALAVAESLQSVDRGLVTSHAECQNITHHLSLTSLTHNAPEEDR